MGWGNGVLVSSAILFLFDPLQRITTSLKNSEYQKTAGLLATMIGEIPHSAFPSSKGDFS